MNMYKSFSRAFLCGLLSLCMLGSSLAVYAYTGSAPQEKTADTNLRVMSYNVLVDNDESLGGWSWGQALGNRGDKASACIEYYQPDVIGFQECNYKWHVSLKENLPDYAFVNADVPEKQYLEKPESLGKKDWMCTTMMYNKNTLTLLENELIGYSVNYWGCIQRMRYISMALFEIKATGERFVFISTHLDAEKDSKGQANRVTQTGELADRIEYYKNKYGCPIISTGDYNSSYSDAPIQQLVNVGMKSHENNRGGIDYILYSAGVTARYFTAVNDTDVAGASDHKPVFADVQVSRSNPFNTAEILSGGATARMEMNEDELGLSFEFSLKTTGARKNGDHSADLSSAMVKPTGGKEYSLMAVGVIVSNDTKVGTNPSKMTLDNLSDRTVNVPAEYLSKASNDSISFTARVINIPLAKSDAVVYARPYYLYMCGGEFFFAYGEIEYDNYEGDISMNDGTLEWQ